MSVKKALCIGINYYKTPQNQLNGCIDDVVNMRNMLVDAYGYNSANVTVLRDDVDNKNTLPTKANILNQLKSLVANSANCKEIWFHYSGHGTQLKNTQPNPVANMYQVIIPSDYNTAGFIADYELYNIIKNVKCTMVLLFDSCSSGTVCDLPWSFLYVNPKTYYKSQITAPVIQNPNIFMFSGCKDSQTSADTYNSDEREYVGAFTNAFCTSLRNNNHNINIMSLYREICGYLTTNKYSQVPVLSSSSQTPNYIFRREIPAVNNTQYNPTIINMQKIQFLKM